MPVVAVVLSVLTFPTAIAACLGLSLIGRRLGDTISPDRLSKKDLRWLAGHDARGESA